MKRETDNIDSILRQLSSIKDYSLDQAKAEADDPDSIWKQDINALEAGIRILSEVQDAGAATVTDAAAMVRRFGISQYTVYSDGVWHCPECNHRAKPRYGFCHWCGQKLAWKTN